jgi:Holliday junction resolvasome RuvABC endonuclease subunit
MIALGYDPGYGTGGGAVVQDLGAGGYLVLHAETIRSDTSQEPRHRYAFIRGKLLWMLQTYEPEVAGVEDQLAVWVGQAKAGRTNAKALHGVVCQGILHGAVSGLGRLGIPVWELTTAHVKQAVAGDGRAGKGAIRTAVELMRRTSNVKRLSSHSADAVAIAVGAIRRERVARATRS